MKVHTRNIVGMRLPEQRRVLGAARLGEVVIIDPEKAAKILESYSRALGQIAFAKDVLSRNQTRGMFLGLPAMIDRAEDYIDDYPVSVYVQVATAVLTTNGVMPSNVTGSFFSQFIEASQAAYAVALEVESQPDPGKAPGGGAPPEDWETTRRIESWLDQEKGLLLIGGVVAVALLAIAID